MPQDLKTDLLIIGAGFAGAAAAFHLSQTFRGSIAILEREQRPGLHASGRNAALVFQAVSHPDIRQLTARSRSAYSRIRQEVGFESTGSLVLGTRERLGRIAGDPTPIGCRWMDPRRVRKLVPLLQGHAFEAALATPGDGVMDIRKLLDFYLARAERNGTKLYAGSPIEGVEGSDPFKVRAGSLTLQARILVNAAGAWADPVGRLAGGQTCQLRPMKRHLFWLGGMPLDPKWPFVWDLENDFYFRPDGKRLLFSICDEAPDASLDSEVSPGVEARLWKAVESFLPALRSSTLEEARACYRTHSLDGNPLLGRDPLQPALFWVAGLGGFGMGASWEVGRLAERAVLGEQPVASFDPARFAPGGAIGVGG